MPIITATVNQSLNDFLIGRERKNWRILGEGMYGTAFGKGQHVWKVQRLGLSDGWPNYINAIVSGRLTGRWVPRIKACIYFNSTEYGQHNALAVLMERLIPSEKMQLPVSPSCISAALYDAVKYRGIKKADPLLYSHIFCKHYFVEFYYPGLIDFVGNIFDVTGYACDCADMHEGNFMLRRCATDLVITDPMA